MSDKSTGNIYHNDYKNQEKHPDYTGFIDITRDQIQALIADGKAGKEVKLKVGMWQYPSKQDPNQSRFFLVVEAGEHKKQEPQKSGGWDDDDMPF